MVTNRAVGTASMPERDTQTQFIELLFQPASPVIV
jgi:hypothetical protein